MLTRTQRLNRRLVILILALIAGLATPLACAQGPLLHSRLSVATADAVKLELPDDDRRWLWRRRTLRLGVTRIDSPPLGMLGNGQHYEGITAEYVNMLSEALRLQVDVVPFDTRDKALGALRAGDIDLLAGGSGTDEVVEGVLRSQPYTTDEPVLVQRVDAAGMDARERTPVLVVPGDYLSVATASGLAPGYQVQATPSLLTGLAAVALGQADAVIANASTVAAQLAQSPLAGREQVSFLPPRPEGVAFLVRDSEHRLLKLINAALAAVSDTWKRQVIETWSRGAARLSEAQPLTVDAAARHWVAAHPQVRVGYLKEFAPLSFENEAGQFKGLAADLLARIGQRTGINFVPVPMASHGALVEALEEGSVDLGATMAFDAEHEPGLRLGRSWISTVPVLVTADTTLPHEPLAEWEGQVIAVPASLGLHHTLAQQWPSIRWQLQDSARHALEQVISRRAAGAVLPYLQAQAMLAGSSGKALRIGAVVPVTPRRYAFAAGPGQQPLLDILDQALLGFEPTVLANMARRWRSEIHIEPEWPSQARWLVPAFTLAGAMLLMAVVWIRLLRRQIRRRRMAEQALTDQLEFTQVMIDGTPHPVYVRDQQGRLRDCNASYLAALGVERADVIGQAVTRIPLVDDQAREYEALYRQVIADGQPIVEDRQLRLRNGQQLTVFHWMLPYRASNGEIMGLIGGWIDITERQRLYDALESAKEEADAANRAKSRFLATASHEIRTPMNAVLGMLELALRKAQTGELDTLAIKVASESASGLLELLNDILDISRMESGHLTLNPRPVEVDALAQQVVQLYDAKAREKALALRLDIKPCDGWSALLDPLRFQQVLGNLLSNAIKFTRKGSVTVSLSAETVGNERLVRLVVEDTGIGIPQADLRHLCKPYQQAGNHQMSGRSGAGLGLSISQHLCRIMGGGLELFSQEGKGSRVEACLRLPVCDAVNPDTPAPAQNVAQAPMSVLVVDDHEPNRLLLAQQLYYLGHRVTVAVDGAHGLREWCSRGGFDVVICDCAMPGLDGYDLARAIRLEEQRKGLPRCRLLACTADTSGDQRARTRDAGIDECLGKPLGLEALAAALAPALPASVQAQPPLVHDGPDALRVLAGGCSASARRLRDSLLQALAQDYQRLKGLPTASPEVDDVVHRVKGGARIVGARPLVECCEAMERGEGTVARLLTEIERLQRHLRTMTFNQAVEDVPVALEARASAARPKPAA